MMNMNSKIEYKPCAQLVSVRGFTLQQKICTCSEQVSVPTTHIKLIRNHLEHLYLKHHSTLVLSYYDICISIHEVQYSIIFNRFSLGDSFTGERESSKSFRSHPEHHLHPKQYFHILHLLPFFQLWLSIPSFHVTKNCHSQNLQLFTAKFTVLPQIKNNSKNAIKFIGEGQLIKLIY